ncbi:MAG: bifunctional methylenetetrahydrofolate dehydrogenase/methenyltetrahydrofolate cyclohydrolase FolD [Pseudomonadota bacterium]
MVQIVDGKEVSKIAREKIAKQVDALSAQDIKVGLAVILVGDNPASHVYVRNKIKACEEVGIISTEKRLDEAASFDEIKNTIQSLNNDEGVHGILLQLPLPSHLKDVQEDLVQMITPEKDVDGLTVTNAGKLFLGMNDGHVPCTPQGSLHLIKEAKQDLSGLNAVVIGRSNLFGKPMAQLLLNENCTVTMAHSRTQDLDQVCAQADIVVAAVGREKMMKAEWVKEGAIVIDVGINRMDNGKLCGDVDFDEVKDKTSAITPVPGGVGPMTITYLLANTVRAAQA